jgi:hypothetical protein
MALDWAQSDFIRHIRAIRGENGLMYSTTGFFGSLIGISARKIVSSISQQSRGGRHRGREVAEQKA